MKVGGIIAAASRKAARPMQRVGTIPAVKRIVLTLQQSGAFPIVVVTGVQADDVRYELSDYGVIFLHNEEHEAPQLFDSFKIGLSYLKTKCERVLLTPVNAPMFSPYAARALLDSGAEVATPMRNGQDGHPVLLTDTAFDDVLSYDGDDGLRGALSRMGERRRRVPVDDRGILHTVHDAKELDEDLGGHNRALLHPFIRLSIEKEAAFFNARTKLLLLLIADTASVRSASEQMALSCSKAWEMLNKLEAELGYPVIERRHGGSRGGRTTLTARGVQFLTSYQKLEESVMACAREEFDRLFRKTGIA